MGYVKANCTHRSLALMDLAAMAWSDSCDVAQARTSAAWTGRSHRYHTKGNQERKSLTHVIYRNYNIKKKCTASAAIKV